MPVPALICHPEAVCTQLWIHGLTTSPELSNGPERRWMPHSGELPSTRTAHPIKAFVRHGSLNVHLLGSSTLATPPPTQRPHSRDTQTCSNRIPTLPTPAVQDKTSSPIGASPFPSRLAGITLTVTS